MSTRTSVTDADILHGATTDRRAGRNIRSKAYHENIVQQMRAQVPLEDATSPQEIALAREPRDAQVYFWCVACRCHSSSSARAALLTAYSHFPSHLSGTSKRGRTRLSPVA